MRAFALLALLAAPAAAARYAEPPSGPSMTIDNQKQRKRLIGVDRYCVRDVHIDGARVFGGFGCKIKHGERRTIRVGPGSRKILLDMMSDFGEDPEIPSEELIVRVDVSTRDFAVVLRGSKAPELVYLDAEDALAAPAAAPAAPAAASAPAVSTSPLPAPPVAPVEASDPFKTLERLKGLYDKGVLSAEEYQAKKAEILKTIR